MKKLVVLLALMLMACKSLPTTPSPVDPAEPMAQTLPCLQVGFTAFVSQQDLDAVSRLGFKVVRHDVQGYEAVHINPLIDATRSAGMEPLLIVRDADQMRNLPNNIMVELRNEPDLEGPDPVSYRNLMLEAALVAKNKEQTLYVGVVSNLNDRGFDYLKAIREFPDNVRVSVHRYGDGTFQNPHRGFSSRHAEYKWLKETVGNRSIAVTEFGYPTSDMSESDQAYRIQQEFEFWHGKTDFTCLYQINDGFRSNERYGIRRLDGTWKPSAHVVNNIR